MVAGCERSWPSSSSAAQRLLWPRRPVARRRRRSIRRAFPSRCRTPRRRGCSSPGSRRCSRCASTRGAVWGSEPASCRRRRGRGRYTMRLIAEKPFFGRFELEGGRFETQNQGLGSTGLDWTGRVLAGAATRITSGVILIASAGLVTRYEVGRSRGGAPTIGIFGIDSNIELEMRLFPTITLSGYLEGAITPWPYLAQSNLGDLSDADQVRVRLQLSIAVSRSATMEFGYDLPRWHSTFTNSTILGTVDRALLVETREHAATFGLRYKM